METQYCIYVGKSAPPGNGIGIRIGIGISIGIGIGIGKHIGKHIEKRPPFLPCFASRVRRVFGAR